MDIREYIIAAIQDTKMDGCKDLVDVMVRRIQQIAGSLYWEDNPVEELASGALAIMPLTGVPPVRHILQYCPYDEKENQYMAQYEASEADYECAKKYIDGAFTIFFDTIVMQGLKDVL